ncbi:MAG TPA: lysylphosphatidylglycerol synthase transmembrane domain-containing protein [Actinoplanes sp.]|nr:lysylphosphatidylglycerol synthase transmembrane domain-containing protein [Actinoplanes sp.]
MTRTVWAWARVLGGAAIIALLVWRLGTGAFLDGLRVVDGGTILAAFGIGVATTVFSAWRWCLVARGLGLRLPLAAAVADYYKALFLNAALPGGVLGDVDRAVKHGRDAGDVGRGVRAVVLERTAGQIVLIAVGVTVLLTVPSPVLVHLEEHGPLLALTGSAVAGVALIGLLTCLRRGTSRAARAARTGFAEVRTGLLAKRNWPGIVLASTVVLAGHLATFVVAARAAGSSASLVRLAPLMLLALLAMTLPVNIGGWGPREGVTAWAFGAAGLSATQGLTIAVVYGVFAFVAALPGGVILATRGIARIRGRARGAAPPGGVILATRGIARIRGRDRGAAPPAEPIAGLEPIQIPVRVLASSSA